MFATERDVQENGLAEAIRVARLRMAVNRWLALSLVSLNCILIALIAGLTVVPTSRPAILAGLGLMLAALIGCGVFIWRTGPGSYDVAQRLDRESHLGDRLSTAIHFWNEPSPSGVVLRQRADALTHLAGIHPKELFPYRMPAKSWRTAALLGAFAVACAYHSVYGTAISRISAKATQSRALASVFAPISRALDLARGEKKELGDLIASNDRNRQSALEKQTASWLPKAGQPDATATAVENSPAMDIAESLHMGNASGTSNTQGANGAVAPGPQTALPANAQSSAALDQQQAAQQQSQGGQQSLAEKALQALANLMGASPSGGRQNNGNAPPSPSSSTTPGATSTQASSGNSQAASATAQAAQGQTSNSESSQNQSLSNAGKHTGAGNGASPWEPRAQQDPQLAGNTATEHVRLQTTGYRGEPGRERSDVAPGTAQIPLQNVAPQTVTTIHGAGQDSVPPRYRQYVRDYFQHSGK